MKLKKNKLLASGLLLITTIGIISGVYIIQNEGSLDLRNFASENTDNQVQDDDSNECTPQCNNLQCGSDGCGGTCGNCGSGYSCKEGQCVYATNILEQEEISIDINADGTITIADLTSFVVLYKTNASSGHPYDPQLDFDGDDSVAIGDVTKFVYLYKVAKGYIPEEGQLLADKSFNFGVAVGYGNTYPDNLDIQCINRWKGIIPSYDSNARWMFWEITERFYFCDNQINNPVVTDNSISYISPNSGLKSFVTDRNGWTRMKYDTGWEWRTGCNLCKKENINVSTEPPKYGNPYTNWPHFLVGQVTSKSYVPGYQGLDINTAIPEVDRTYLTDYSKITFTGSFKLNKADDSIGGNCPDGDWKPNSCNEDPSQCTENCSSVPNHAIYYLGFVLWRKERVTGKVNIIYALAPLVYTTDGSDFGLEEGKAYVIGDQFGETTYFGATEVTNGSREYIPHLVSGGDWKDVNIDVKKFAVKALEDITEQKDLDTPLQASDYHLAHFFMGWEIWGGFDTDIEAKDISLKVEN